MKFCRGGTDTRRKQRKQQMKSRCNSFIPLQKIFDFLILSSKKMQHEHTHTHALSTLSLSSCSAIPPPYTFSLYNNSRQFFPLAQIRAFLQQKLQCTITYRTANELKLCFSVMKRKKYLK